MQLILIASTFDALMLMRYVDASMAGGLHVGMAVVR
jgi:hypothetical protein